MMELAAVVVGVAIGLVIGWLLAVARSRRTLEDALREAETSATAAISETIAVRKELESRKVETEGLRAELRDVENARAALDARADEMRLRFEEQQRILAEAERKLSDTFRSLAADVLKTTNESFLTLAGERLNSVRQETSADLEARQKAIEGVIAPVKESLETLDSQIRAIENVRSAAYGSLSEQVRSLAETQTQLRSETANLVKALRAPVVRGRWGEIQLKRVVELAGMIDHCDFFEQGSVTTDDGRLRPDLVVRLPGDKNIVVDAKAPLQAYLEALEAPTDEIRAAKLKEHAAQVRIHTAKLSAKGYWEHLQPTPEFVVLFLPGETFFSAALEQDPSLIEMGVSQRVILATPTTLIALLRAVSYGWRQELVAENAQKISELGQELYERIATMVEHLASLRSSLNTSVTAFNRTVGALQERVLPSVRKFKELGIASKKDLKEFEPIDNVPRELPATESAIGFRATLKSK
ncbi:MAG TPA: DNA recombination protein RmuC [Candidatus Binataceae bacterium]|jgi:DNA recombination protein RmuC